MKFKIGILALAFFFFSENVFAGGGWPQPKGGGYFKLTQWWLVSDKHYTDVGLIDPNTTNGLFNTSIYGEYGFTDRLTGILYFPFFCRAYFNNTISGTTNEILIPGESINSIGDMDMSIKYGITLNKPIALSATLTIGLPFGNENGGTVGSLQTGDGEFNQMILMDAGAGFQISKVAAYTNVFAGVNNRTKGFSDEFRFGIEVGATFLHEKLTARAKLYGVSSFKNGDLPANRSNSTSIFANNSEHLTFSPEFAVHLNNNWGISANYAVALSGNLIFASPSYSFGVFLKLVK